MFVINDEITVRIVVLFSDSEVGYFPVDNYPLVRIYRHRLNQRFNEFAIICGFAQCRLCHGDRARADFIRFHFGLHRSKLTVEPVKPSIPFFFEFLVFIA